MDLRIISILLSGAIFVFVVDLVRREKLTFKYAIGWILSSLVAILLVIFDEMLDAIASSLGFTLTSNFIFCAALSVFILLGLFLTIFLCQQNNRNDKMAQKIGLLEQEIEQLKKNQ